MTASPSFRSSDNEDTKSPKSLEVRLELPAGIGISLIRNQCEELIYALFKGVELTLLNKNENYQLNGHVNVIQVSFETILTNFIFRSIINCLTQNDGPFYIAMRML